MKKFLKRFERLENTFIHKSSVLKKGAKKSKRFEKLEINERTIEFSIVDKVTPEETAPSNIRYYLYCPFCGKVNLSDANSCSHCKRDIRKDFIADYEGKEKLLKKCMCGAINLKERKNCWVCGKDFSSWESSEVMKSSENVITLNIDGRMYRSTDEDLPPDIQELMRRIRLNGYSQDIINQWMQERNSKIIEQKKEVEDELERLRLSLTWRVAALVVFILFVIFQLRACFFRP